MKRYWENFLLLVFSLSPKALAYYEITKECETALLEVLNLHLKNAPPKY